MSKPTAWVPSRQDVIWIDCNHPFLVLSPKAFNAKTLLVVGLPMTTAEYNADNPFAVAVGPANSKPGATSYVLCHQPKSFDWRARGGKKHPMGKLGDGEFAEVRLIVEQIMQLTTA